MVREAMAHLTVDEANVSHLESSGVSSKEIASIRGCAVEAVDAVFHRAKLKMAKVLGVQPRTRAVRRAR